MKSLSLFGTSKRISFNEAVNLTVKSMETYGPKYDIWVFCWSGGKDSTALITLIISLIRSGQIKAPQKIIILYADTRMELAPLAWSAQIIMQQLRSMGIEVRVVMAEMDKRFFVYMLGRGIPPPNNMTLRWCTRQIKIDPMAKEVKKLYDQYGKSMLMLTGVRQGESAIRDGRIVQSCTRDGGECGQGWYQEMKTEGVADKLAPLLHWRVCGIWDWLKIFAPMEKYGGWKTELLADAYGGDEAEEINARTGCVGCPLAAKDTAIEGLLRVDKEKWGHLEPLLGLRNVYQSLRLPKNRLRKQGDEKNKDGRLSKNQYRMGPLTMAARKWGLFRILKIQKQVNEYAERIDMPKIDILNINEVIRINELIVSNTWPNKWNGNEPTGDQYFTNKYDRRLELFIKNGWS